MLKLLKTIVLICLYGLGVVGAFTGVIVFLAMVGYSIQVLTGAT